MSFCVMKTNQIHYLSLIYFLNQSVHVSGNKRVWNCVDVDTAGWFSFTNSTQHNIKKIQDKRFPEYLRNKIGKL
jgi:hypothetical protein